MKTPKPAEAQPSEPYVPLTKDELLLLQDVADGLSVLQTIARFADDGEVRIIQLEWIIRKIADPLWNLAHDDLWSRWDKSNPEAKLFEKGGEE